MVATQTYYLYQYIRKTHLGILVSTKTYKSTRKAHLSLWRAGHSTEQSIENPFILTQTMVVRIPWWSFIRNKFLFIRPEFDHCCHFFSLTLDWGDSGWWGCPIDVVADVVDNLMTADSLTTALSQIDHNLDCLVTSYIFFSWPNSLTSYNLP